MNTELICEVFEAVIVAIIRSLKAVHSSEDFVENSHRGSFEPDNTDGREIKIISLLINSGMINNGTVLTINITQRHKTCECENQ